MNTKMIVFFLCGMFFMAALPWFGGGVHANGASPPFSNQTVIYRLDEMKTELNGLRHELQTVQKQLETVENKLQESTNHTQGESGESVTQLKLDVSSIQSTLENRIWLEVAGFLIILSIVGYLVFKI